MKNFNGKILFLDRSDINTDEIIPAKYLTELTKAALKPYGLEDLSLEGFDPKKDIEGKAVIVTTPKRKSCKRSCYASLFAPRRGTPERFPRPYE